MNGGLAHYYNAAMEVGKSIFFSAAIIIAGFVPLFTLSGIEGHIFAPMARTYAYALLGGLIATFTIVPAFSALFLHVAGAGRRNANAADTVKGFTAVPSLSSVIAPNAWVSRRSCSPPPTSGGIAGPRIPSEARRREFLDQGHAASLHLA